MSESDGDFSDELLELAGAGEKKRKKSSSSKAQSKRRKADVESDSEKNYESEEDDSNPYPLEGKYANEADRMNLMQMPEIEREELLASRLEEQQRLQDKRNLDQMLRVQRGDPDSVSKAAKRAHAVRGATKEKSRKLDELKAKRKAKSEKKRVKANSPKRERSSSPMDMEMSSEDEEDGQISKLEEQEERESRLLSKSRPEDDVTTLEDLEKCRLTRDAMCKYSKFPWFEDYVKGAWVRYLIGNDKSGPVYRICEIISLGSNSAKKYKIEGEYFDQTLELKYGKATKVWPIDRVSNSAFTADEWRRMQSAYEAEKVKIPTKRVLEKKVAQLVKLPEQQLTENDINAMLRRKNELQSTQVSGAKSTLERSRLLQMRSLAEKRRDTVEVAELDEQIAALNARLGESGAHKPAEETRDVLAMVNERNRKANLEAVRRAEAAEADRKRRDRKLALAAAAGGGSRPGTPVDPSARLRTLPRMFEDNSRNVSPNGTPRLGATPADTRSVSPLPGGASGSPQKGPSGKRTFESIVASSVDVDLGDF